VDQARKITALVLGWVEDSVMRSDISEFYNQRFQMNLSTEEKEELTAFLNAL
jgi:hypothetical protein